ncbi:hypothetical protein ACIGZJ_22210 [Kitasatospora sp. NPDC052868]|uniref:hypothetical protein n=1 Tax=Kitasatospora sp. NPDC052868 TaxID=3364060 RepID=UPI0037C9D11A
MTRFNRQRVKAATRVEIRTETPEVFAAGASGQLALHGRWPVVPWLTYAPSTAPGPSALTEAWLTNHQGGAGWQRDPRTDLFVLAVTHFSGQHSFYERATDREERFTSLVRRFALEDPCWTLGLLRWLRGQAQIRSAAVAGAVEFAQARAEAKAGSRPVQAAPDDPLLAVVERFHDLGGTDTAGAVARHFDDHHRVVVITDEQPGLFGRLDPFASVPPGVPVYTWNLCGYRTGHAPPAPNRHVFGGLSDAAFRLVPLLEAGGTEQWPWELPTVG